MTSLGWCSCFSVEIWPWWRYCMCVCVAAQYVVVDWMGVMRMHRHTNTQIQCWHLSCLPCLSAFDEVTPQSSSKPSPFTCPLLMRSLLSVYDEVRSSQPSVSPLTRRWPQMTYVHVCLCGCLFDSSVFSLHQTLHSCSSFIHFLVLHVPNQGQHLSLLSWSVHPAQILTAISELSEVRFCLKGLCCIICSDITLYALYIFSC